MKRVLINDMPWDILQEEYDNGKSIRDLSKTHNMAGKTFIKAAKLGLFKIRNRTDAAKVRAKIKPNDYSETRKHRSALVNYRADCAFKFNLSDFPDEFDFTLIENYGWYKPKNRGNNLYGVSRDHAVSVKYGFEHNLPAEHLAHPANCVLMRHGDNVTKYSKNSISYDELLERIVAWNKKYSGD